MKRKQSPLEAKIQADIEAALGAEPDLLLLRNSVGEAVYVARGDGREFHVPYGLGKGSPDLVGILRETIYFESHWEGRTLIRKPRVFGRWFCLEVKAPGERPSAEQVKCRDVWHAFGAFVATVTSVDEARAAFDEARRGPT